MKKIIPYLFLIVTFLSCAEKEAEKPKNLIPQDKMEEILYDLNFLQAIRNTNYQVFQRKNINPEEYIYTKYNVDSLQFAQSNKYYVKNPENYEKMIDRIVERINQEKQKLQAQEPTREEKPTDSLRRKPKTAAFRK